jgi:heme-degrading monooxygenase HmoA
MRQFPGYVDHKIVRGLDDPGHVLVISHWTSREAEPRRRWIGVRVEDCSAAGKEAA